MIQSQPNRPNKFSGKAFMNRLHIMFYAFISIPLALFAMGFIYMAAVPHLPLANANLLRELQIAVPTLAVLILAIGYLLFKAVIKKARQRHQLRIKLAIYKAITVFRLIFFEFIAIIALVAFFMTDDMTFVLYFMVGLLLFGINRPSVQRVGDDLQLSQQDREKLTGYETLM